MWLVAKKLSGDRDFASMPQTEHEPLVAVLGTRENCDGSVISTEANGSVSCLPTGVLSDGIASSKSPTWKKSGMRLKMVLFRLIV